MGRGYDRALGPGDSWSLWADSLQACATSADAFSVFPRVAAWSALSLAWNHAHPSILHLLRGQRAVRDRRRAVRDPPELDAEGVPVRAVPHRVAVRGAGERDVHGEPERRRHRAGGQRGALNRHEDRLRRPRPAVADRVPHVRGAGRARIPGAEGWPLVFPRAPRAHVDVPAAVVRQRRFGRGHLRAALPGVSRGALSRSSNIVPFEPPRSRRLRAPLLVTLWWLLGIEAVGGLTLFFMRLVAGRMP